MPRASLTRRAVGIARMAFRGPKVVVGLAVWIVLNFGHGSHGSFEVKARKVLAVRQIGVCLFEGGLFLVVC